MEMVQIEDNYELIWYIPITFVLGQSKDMTYKKWSRMRRKVYEF